MENMYVHNTPYTVDNEDLDSLLALRACVENNLEIHYELSNVNVHYTTFACFYKLLPPSFPHHTQMNRAPSTSTILRSKSSLLLQG